MAYRVLTSRRAEQDIADVLAWLDEHASSTVADRWLTQLMSKLGGLESHPERFPLAAEAETLGVELREMLIGKRSDYRLLFRIVGETVEVIRIRHTARDVLGADEVD